MATRPLTEKESADIRLRLRAAGEQLLALSRYIAQLKQELEAGTVWCYEPEAFRKMCKEVEEKVAAWKKQEEEREIARYGRPLTDDERRWRVARPKEREVQRG
ncbi:hypothetical protein ES703_66549 [subsurface metagenome]